jgi:Notch-like protein
MHVLALLAVLCVGGPVCGMLFYCMFSSQQIDLCALDPCGVRGVCTVREPGSFYCACVAGYTGLYCETDFDRCLPNPCASGATCRISDDASLACLCRPGTTGTQCESEINECASSPCSNGGTCS